MASFNPVTVLSVDDSEATRYARRRALEAAGFSVLDAGTGRDALAIARVHRPTVAVLDIHLPDMDGYEVCRRLKGVEETAGIAVLQISAMYDSDEARVTALDGGADAYLSEPVDPKVLQATVNALARMRKAEREQRAANARLALLSETASRLLTVRDPREFMRDFFPRIAQELGLEIYFNFLVTDEQPPRLKLHCYGGVPEEIAREVEHLDFGEAVCGTVALTRERAVIEDLPNTDELKAAAVRQMGIRAYACHPLLADGRMLGTLSFGSKQRDRFEPEELELLLAVSNQFAAALERARLDSELQRQAARLSAVLDNTLAVVYVVDLEGRFQLANRRYESLFGKVTPGVSVRDMFPPEAADAYLANNRAVFESGRACEFEETAIHPDGPHTYVSIKVPLFDAEGRAIAVCGISTDITRRKQAAEEVRERERRIRRLVDSNIVGVILVDKAEQIREANDLFLATVQYTREDLQSGRLNWMALTPPEHAESSARANRELLARGAFAPFEKEYFRKDGSRVPILIGGALLGDGERLCFVLDLSERKKTESALRDAQKLESLGFLAGGVAHNLNNQLVGIMGNVSLAMSETESPEAQERLESALTACERAAHLASELLAYAGKGRYFPTPIHVSELISRDLEAVLRGSVTARIDMRFQLDPGLPELRLDANQIRQVITNLAQNAAEAIGEAEGAVTVATRRKRLDAATPGEGFAGGTTPPAGDYVMISVSDTGPGIDQATRAKIFDPFFTTKFTGRGLGLSAAAGIARAYGGGIRVISAPGMGSTFEVYLPAPEETVTTGESAGTAPAASDRQRVVLVVDDEPLVRQTMRAALERGGFTVLVAGSGVQAVEILEEQRSAVDLVLLDLAMPGMSGEETLERLREIRADVPIAICSGYAESQVSPRFSGKNVRGFVKKPFTPQKLLAAARELARG